MAEVDGKTLEELFSGAEAYLVEPNRLVIPVDIAIRKAQQAIEEEREGCAKVTEERVLTQTYGWARCLKQIAKMIRSRGEKGQGK